MSYEVLARKYRSKTFEEIVGQAAIATTLKNAVASDRIHHGYLFTGTRGVGKTSMARILAKALNCLSFDAPTATPCGTCDSCLRIGDGDDLDVVEIDAASNTGVENIRELRSNAAFRPVRSRFKVYIIDEVHMLSTGAFNALLKTLEEPPDHVKFILATTESHKVPATIQSRCQRFDFRSIGADEIAGQLRALLKSEGVAAEDAVVRRISRLANGSMRDALSILDQLLAFGASELSSALMEDLLPSAHNELVTALVEAIAEDDAAKSLQRADEMLCSGYTPPRLCDAVIEHLRALMLLRVCGAETDLVDVSGAARDQLSEQCQKFDAASYVYMIALLEQVRRQLQTGGASRAILDAAIVRLAMSSAFTRIDELVGRIGRQPASIGDSAKKKEPPQLAARDSAVGPSAPRGAAATTVPSTSASEPPTEVGGRRATARTGAPTHPPRNSVRNPDTGGAPTDSGAPPLRKPVPSTVSAAQRQRALSSPLVRAVMEKTGGRIVDIRPTSGSATDSGDDSQPDEDSSGEASDPDVSAIDG